MGLFGRCEKHGKAEVTYIGVPNCPACVAEERARVAEAERDQALAAFDGLVKAREYADGHNLSWQRKCEAAESEAKALSERVAQLEGAVIDVLRNLKFTGRACSEDASWLSSYVVHPLDAALQTPQHSPEGRPPAEGHDNDDFIPCGDHCGEVTCELEKGHWEDHQRTEDGEVTWWPIDYDETPPKEPK